VENFSWTRFTAVNPFAVKLRLHFAFSWTILNRLPYAVLLLALSLPHFPQIGQRIRMLLFLPLCTIV
jgi:hypothetical protein